jgi:hypothetical protein
LAAAIVAALVRHFPLYEMKLVLASILSDFELALADPRPVSPVRRGVTMAPAGDLKYADSLMVSVRIKSDRPKLLRVLFKASVKTKAVR